MKLVVGVDHHRAKTLGTEKQCVDRNLQTIAGNLDVKMDLSITAGKQFASFVGDVNFGEESAGNRVDRFGGAHDFAEEFATGELCEIEVSGEAGMDGGRGALRNIQVNANGIGLREREELLGGAAVAGVDQCSDIHVAAGDDAAEGSVNMLEGFQFGEAMDVGLRGSDTGLFGGQIAGGVVHFLFGDAVGLD